MNITDLALSSFDFSDDFDSSTIKDFDHLLPEDMLNNVIDLTEFSFPADSIVLPINETIPPNHLFIESCNDLNHSDFFGFYSPDRYTYPYFDASEDDLNQNSGYLVDTFNEFEDSFQESDDSFQSTNSSGSCSYKSQTSTESDLSQYRNIGKSIDINTLNRKEKELDNILPKVFQENNPITQMKSELVYSHLATPSLNECLGSIQSSSFSPSCSSSSFPSSVTPSPSSSPTVRTNKKKSHKKDCSNSTTNRSARKSKSVPVEEKVEFVRERNREHARSTRHRKKVYIEQLKRQVSDLLKKQEQLENGSIEYASSDHIKQISEKKSIIQQFLHYRSDGVSNPKQWKGIIDEQFFTMKQPFIPFLPMYGDINASVVRVVGMDNLIKDTKMFNSILNNVKNCVKSLRPDISDYFSIGFESDPNDILITQDKAMCHFVLTTQNLMLAGFHAECRLDGMMKSQFSPGNKIISVEFTYDIVGFLIQLARFQLLSLPFQNLMMEIAPSILQNTSFFRPSSLPSNCLNFDISNQLFHCPVPLTSTLSTH